MTRERATATQSMFWRARQRKNLSRAALVDLANQQPEATEAVPDDLPRILETRLVCVPRRLAAVKAIARALGLPWDEVLATMGLR